jgi:hypothetical protein
MLRLCVSWCSGAPHPLCGGCCCVVVKVVLGGESSGLSGAAHDMQLVDNRKVWQVACCC